MAVQRIPITGPFKGIITDLPPTSVANGFEDSVNFIGWKGRQRTRPGLNIAGGFSSPDGSPILNMTSFEDIENFLHTLALTGSNAYMLTAGLVLNKLTYPSTYISSLVIGSGGNGYLVDDILTVVQGSAYAGTAQVNSTDTSTGAITTIGVFPAPGTGYVIGDVVDIVQSGAAGGKLTVVML
jgi:hypothetical protein